MTNVLDQYKLYPDTEYHAHPNNVNSKLQQPYSTLIHYPFIVAIQVASDDPFSTMTALFFKDCIYNMYHPVCKLFYKINVYLYDP